NGWTRKIAEKWRINFFCLIGVSIGIFSLFLIWEDTYLLGLTGWNYSYSVTAFEGHLWLFGILVLLSTIISIITPLGGCVQFWLVGYYLFMELSGSSILEMKTYLGLGPWLALFSAIIVLFSMIIPLGIGFNKLPLKLKERLLTFSRIKSQS
ncbi:MAG: hypothetical protein OEV21_03190, partial [Thermoplasmata archaeon]|nr:hypothetical protein [Thermoplasmata archaeon]